MQKGESSKGAFPTQNVALAKALHIAGVPWYKDHLGRPMAILNDYTVDTLREIDKRRAACGQRPLNLASMTHEEGVRTAYRNGICGNVTYQFEAGELLARVLAGYDKQSALIAQSDAKKLSHDEQVGEPLDCSPETLGAICCQFTKAGQLFQGTKTTKPLWMLAPPFAVELNLSSSSRPLNSARTAHERVMQGSLRRTEVHV